MERDFNACLLAVSADPMTRITSMNTTMDLRPTLRGEERNTCTVDRAVDLIWLQALPLDRVGGSVKAIVSGDGRSPEFPLT